MKKLNTNTGLFEDYTEDQKLKNARNLLLQNKVPFHETSDGIFIENKDEQNAINAGVGTGATP